MYCSGLLLLGSVRNKTHPATMEEIGELFGPGEQATKSFDQVYIVKHAISGFVALRSCLESLRGCRDISMPLVYLDWKSSLTNSRKSDVDASLLAAESSKCTS
nr:hypothetical protein CFP56_32191 [Quercus suber]